MPKPEAGEARFRAAVRAIAEDSAVRDCLSLISRGVPFDVAFSLDDVTRTAWCIVQGQLEGMTFDWSGMQWVKKRD